MFEFPSDFRWGTATASYQVEGAVDEDGRGESIWDRFTHTPGTVEDRTNGDVACDHYHQWRDDIRLMAELGQNAYRFSVAWPRVYPEGRGRLNQPGIDFYSRLTDELLAAGIEPTVTLYHWDLPQALQDRGGWPNRDTAKYFTDYAHAVFSALGDRVRKWITLNEPWVISHLGYGQGVHAPGIADPAAAIAASHVLNLAHAGAVRLFRSDFSHAGEIGITLSLSPIYPLTDRDDDAARVADGYTNRWFLDPVLRGAYPQDMTEVYAALGWVADIREGDMEQLAGAPVDFLGVNHYTRQLVTRAADTPLQYRAVIPDSAPTTEMGWEIYAEGLYDLLTRVHRDYGAPVMYITENGIACRDTVIADGVVQDDDRIDYLRDHLFHAWRAIQEGVDLRGYYLWTLIDNFEWARGFTMRFGIVGMAPGKLERVVKKSGYWYRDVIDRGGLPETEDPR